MDPPRPFLGTAKFPCSTGGYPAELTLTQKRPARMGDVPAHMNPPKENHPISGSCKVQGNFELRALVLFVVEIEWVVPMCQTHWIETLRQKPWQGGMMNSTKLVPRLSEKAGCLLLVQISTPCPLRLHMSHTVDEALTLSLSLTLSFPSSTPSQTKDKHFCSLSLILTVFLSESV